MEIIDPKSDWIFSIQPSIWKKDKLISILKKNLNVNIWDLEYKSQRVVRKLNIQIGVLAGNCKQRGMYHCDSEYYPYIATALFKGKWTISEYEKELSILFDKYNIDPLIRENMNNLQKKIIDLDDTLCTTLNGDYLNQNL